MRQKHRRVGPLALAIILLALLLLTIGSPDAGILFVLAVSPSAILLWYFYHADKYKHESLKLLGGTFLLGAVMFVVAGLVESVIPQPASDTEIIPIFLYFLLGVGLVEEMAKFLSVRIYAYRSSSFDEPMDGIIFGVAAALGFATLENLNYVFSYGVGTALVRAVVSVPGHALWGAIMGFYLAESKIRGRPILALIGVSIAIFLHGLFDTLASVIPYDIVSFFVLLALVWIIYARVVRKEIAEAESESPYRLQEAGTGRWRRQQIWWRQVGDDFIMSVEEWPDQPLRGLVHPMSRSSIQERCLRLVQLRA